MAASAMNPYPERLLIALGGNAIHPAGIKGTGQEQFDYAAKAAEHLLPILSAVPVLVITHGNGPGVGKVLMRQAIASKRVASMPLDICVANSQGGISYVIMQALQNSLRRSSTTRPVASIVCEVEVDPADPAFADPDKPLGYFFTEEEARDLIQEFNWTMKEDARRGWRMVVASPRPQRILDIETIRCLLERGVIVITAGGGGIPVAADTHGILSGVEAVIDKDLTSALLARALDIEELLILTSIDCVKVHFGTEQERDLRTVTLTELKKWRDDGQFSAGSMGPKVDAVIEFIEGGGRQAVIAHLDKACEALRGLSGTRVTAG